VPGLNGTELMHALSILASGSNKGSGSAGLIQIGILLLIPLAMYFLMIRPQRRRVREQQAMQSSLEVGDEVMTASGIYGFITAFEDDRVWVEIDDDVQIRVNRGFLQGKVPTSGGGSAPAAAAGGSTSGGKSGGRFTPTVKGVRADKSADAQADPADGDPADRNNAE